MRSICAVLPLATLFLGLCLIHRDDDKDVKQERTLIFFTTLIVIAWGL